MSDELRKAAQDVIDAYDGGYSAHPQFNLNRRIEALRAALAAPEQEPFAWATFDGEGSYDLRLYECNENYRDDYLKRNGDKYAGWVEPLYRHPALQQAQPVRAKNSGEQA